MRQTITNIFSILLVLAAVMAFAFWLPWVATGLTLFLQVFILILVGGNIKSTGGDKPS